MIMSGQRIIKIVSTANARKYGNWYKDLLDKEFDVIQYDICAAEYTVKYGEDTLLQLPDEDVTIVKDTSSPQLKGTPTMKHSVRYVQVKLEIDHDENVDPDDIINECDYSFRVTHAPTPSYGIIRGTEIIEISGTSFNS
jgi:hypothetical protein